MFPRHGYHRTVFALLALFISAVAVAIPYNSLFSQGVHPDVTMAASSHTAIARSPIPSVRPIAQNDPQKARTAQETARDSYHATVLRREARKKRAQAQAATVASTPAPPVTQVPAAAPATPAVPAPQGDPQQIAEAMLASYGWPVTEFACLLPLWMRESGWNVYASNPGSGAYGIPQALPGDKMASAGADWQTSATVQITWGLGYIESVYGTPCNAWSHEESVGWY